jgi:hypothetical protein
VVSKGAKTFTIQVGQRQEIVSVDRLNPHTGLGPVSPAEAALQGCRLLLLSSLHLHEAADWGGPVEDRVSLIVAPVRQFILVT